MNAAVPCRTITATPSTNPAAAEASFARPTTSGERTRGDRFAVGLGIVIFLLLATLVLVDIIKAFSVR